MEYNRLTLEFAGEHRRLEAEFRDFYFGRHLVLFRWALLFGILFYAGFGILDAIEIPTARNQTWLIRYGIVCPLLLGTWWLSFVRDFQRYMQVAAVALILVGGSGIVMMIALAPPPGNAAYYAGLILVFLFSYAGFRTRFIWATGVCWGLIVLYEIVAIHWVHLPWKTLLSNNFFLVSCNLMGMFLCYSLEYLDRKSFFLHHLLHEEKNRVTQVNAELEDKVQKLEKAAEQIRTLQGLVPICARCKKIRDDQGFWNQLETYFTRHSDVVFSHSLCPDCVKLLYPELGDGGKEKPDSPPAA